ncbi:MAG: hypothetical protein R3212_04680 [Xanthomonadales bacterium]|nr:hypothetical protein [Xanthomonadales bacterium]
MLRSSDLLANPRWHWEDRFNPGERENLTDWVRHAHAGLERLFGEMPYSYDVHFHRTGRSREPVPWAHTWKYWNRRAVNFYVDPRYSNREFESDWTAYHELSHLMFPYLGRSGMWFAEGIASYLQYQAMYAAGELSWSQAITRYQGRFNAARKYRRLDDYAIVDLVNIGRRSGSNVRLYWGGAAYFLEVDRRLHSELGIRLNDVIRDYLDCCFGSRGRGASGMIRTFDRLSGSRIFSDVYRETVKEAGFPETRAGLAWLENHPPPTRG